MEIIPFIEKYRQDFIDINTDWIVSNFGALEEHDIESFKNIDEQMQAGAMIFFAVENDTVLATCMAAPMEGITWEICKLGANKNVPHKGAGSAVFEASMKWAMDHGAERLFIVTNTKLKPALHIYEKYGFKEIQLADYGYTRGNIALEYIKTKNNVYMEKTAITIQTYTEADRDEIITLVLHCQNDGTRPIVSVEDQPELLHIKERYLDAGGNFWVAKKDGRVAGSIGLMMCGEGLAILKKFFVYEPYRGKPYHLGRKLYEVLLAFAKSKGVKKIILDTPKNTERAHKFYEKAGFKKISKEELPIVYDYPYEESDFFSLEILM